METIHWDYNLTVKDRENFESIKEKRFISPSGS
jgi:hypothetical protein